MQGTRNQFIENISNSPLMRGISQKEKMKRFTDIMRNVEEIGIFDPIVYTDEDVDILRDSIIADLVASDWSEDKAEIAAEKICKSDESREEEILSEQSLFRIREKRIELSKIIELGIILTEEDYEQAPKIDDNKIRCGYGRNVCHQAIALRNMTLLQKNLKKKYLLQKDNNGNIPYEMAFQQDYKAAIKILKEAMKKYKIKF